MSLNFEPIIWALAALRFDSLIVCPVTHGSCACSRLRRLQTLVNVVLVIRQAEKALRDANFLAAAVAGSKGAVAGAGAAGTAAAAPAAATAKAADSKAEAKAAEAKLEAGEKKSDAPGGPSASGVPLTEDELEMLAPTLTPEEQV